MTTPADISRALRSMRQVVDDLPDGMGVAVHELCEGWRLCPADERPAAAEAFAEAIAELCDEEGLPSPLGEGGRP